MLPSYFCLAIYRAIRFSSHHIALASFLANPLATPRPQSVHVVMKNHDDTRPFKPLDMPEPVLDPDALYLGDNGRCFCGKHAGASAKFSGRDISGQRVERVDVEACKREGFTPRCEDPECRGKR
jgi:hypothetical protein